MGDLCNISVREFIVVEDVCYRFVCASSNYYRYESEDGTPIFLDEEFVVKPDDLECVAEHYEEQKEAPRYPLDWVTTAGNREFCTPPYSTMNNKLWLEALSRVPQNRRITPLQVLNIYKRLKHGKHS